MRLLVLDGSSVLPYIVNRLVPEDVQVETVKTFDEARERLQRDPPDAVILNIFPSNLPWTGLQALCHGHNPPIPVLYESSVWENLEEAGLEDDNGHSHFLKKPYPIEELRAELKHLLMLAAEGPLHLDEGAEDDTLH